MTSEAYRVGDVHPSTEREIRTGDHVTLQGFPGTLFVMDVRGNRLELLAPASVRIIAEAKDCKHINEDAA